MVKTCKSQYMLVYYMYFRPESVSGREDKKVLWYALVVGQPSGTRDLLKKASSLLVAEMATCDLSVEISAELRQIGRAHV